MLLAAVLAGCAGGIARPDSRGVAPSPSIATSPPSLVTTSPPSSSPPGSPAPRSISSPSDLTVSFLGTGYSVLVPTRLAGGYRSDAGFDYWSTDESSSACRLGIQVTRKLTDAERTLEGFTARVRHESESSGVTFVSSEAVAVPAGPATRMVFAASPPGSVADRRLVAYSLVARGVGYMVMLVRLGEAEEQAVMQSLRLDPDAVPIPAVVEAGGKPCGPPARAVPGGKGSWSLFAGYGMAACYPKGWKASPSGEWQSVALDSADGTTTIMLTDRGPEATGDLGEAADLSRMLALGPSLPTDQRRASTKVAGEDALAIRLHYTGTDGKPIYGHLVVLLHAGRQYDIALFATGGAEAADDALLGQVLESFAFTR